MQVYVLESRIDYEGGCVCGVYSTRALAEAAAQVMADADTLGGVTYVVHAVGVDAPAHDRILVEEDDIVDVAA